MQFVPSAPLPRTATFGRRPRGRSMAHNIASVSADNHAPLAFPRLTEATLALATRPQPPSLCSTPLRQAFGHQGRPSFCLPQNRSAASKGQTLGKGLAASPQRGGGQSRSTATLARHGSRSEVSRRWKADGCCSVWPHCPAFVRRRDLGVPPRLQGTPKVLSGPRRRRSFAGGPKTKVPALPRTRSRRQGSSRTARLRGRRKVGRRGLAALGAVSSNKVCHSATLAPEIGQARMAPTLGQHHLCGSSVGGCSGAGRTNRSRHHSSSNILPGIGRGAGGGQAQASRQPLGLALKGWRWQKVARQ